jgi:hypothetical protein
LNQKNVSKKGGATSYTDVLPDVSTEDSDQEKVPQREGYSILFGCLSVSVFVNSY